jgi:hypothetical protein
MKRNYDLYHDTVFMDATYACNMHSMPLVVFSGVSNEGRNVIMGFGLVRRETMETYEWLLSTLSKLNETREPAVLLTDFDASMAGAIERSLPKTTHLLCQWHMMQNLKKNFLFLTKRMNSSSKILYKLIVYDLLFTPDPFKFRKIVESIFFMANELLDDQKISYLRNLLLIKEKWSRAFAPRVFTAGTHTTSRSESVNSQIK